mgnify:FL=1
MRELPAAARRSQNERIANEILMYFRNLKKSAGDVYISDPIDTDKDGNALTMMDIISDDEESMVDSLDLKFRSQQLYEYIQKCLSSRERTIIVLRYGLGGQKALTQREVAKKLGISRSYVSRIEKKALLALRGEFER